MLLRKAVQRGNEAVAAGINIRAPHHSCFSPNLFVYEDNCGARDERALMCLGEGGGHHSLLGTSSEIEAA